MAAEMAASGNIRSKSSILLGLGILAGKSEIGKLVFIFAEKKAGLLSRCRCRKAADRHQNKRLRMCQRSVIHERDPLGCCWHFARPRPTFSAFSQLVWLSDPFNNCTSPLID